MAEIACLSWGSLVWEPGKLLIKGPWHSDGPQVCVDFLRQSSNRRITLVLDNSAAPVQSLWAVMNTNDVDEAIGSLAERETKHADWTRNIGVWRNGDPSPSPHFGSRGVGVQPRPQCCHLDQSRP
jgi:hypothetical protein